MRPRILALLLAAVCVTPALAGDQDSKSSRSGKKSGTPVIQVMVIEGGDAQVLPPPPVGNGGAVTPAPAPAPPAAAPTLDEPGHTPCVNCSDPSAGPKGSGSCPPRLAAKVFPKFDKPRPGLDCEGCSTFRCEWRFLFGGCRAFYNEGPFMPHWPDNCPCGK